MFGSPPSKRAWTGKAAIGAETPAVRGDAVDDWTKKWLGAGFSKDLLQAIVRYRRAPAATAPSTVGPLVDTGKIPVSNAERKRQRAMAGDGGENAAPTSPPVFVVTDLERGRWIDVESKVLRVYSNLAAANDYVLGYVSKFLGSDGIFDNEWKRTQEMDGYYGVGWDVAPDGCLRIVDQKGKHGTKELEVLLHSVQDAPPTVEIE